MPETTITSALPIDQFPFGQVRQWLAEGTVVPFLGAGASLVGPSGPPLPAGSGLADELVEIMGGAFDASSPIELAKVAQFYEHNVFDRAALYEFLHDRFVA